MASGLEDMGKENDSMAGRKETASEKKADKNPFQTAAALFGNCGVISVLFETPSGFTPSGFAIFGYNAAKLTEPEAVKAFWMRAFQAFEVKDRAINNTYVSPVLSKMIRKYVLNGQTLAVGNEDYKNVIYETLGIPCVYSPVIKELMWCLRIQIRRFLPPKNSEITNADRFPMSEGMVSFLNYHKFDINPHVTVTKCIIEMAGVVYKCDRCVNKHGTYLRLAAQHLMEISQIDSRCWDLMKLATALKMICDPEDKISDAQRLFSKRQLKKLTKDAPQYTDKISKGPCLEVYKEMYSARKTRLQVARVLVRLVEQAKTAYEAEQAGKAASDCEIGPDRKKICRGFDSVIIDELTECHTTLSANLCDG